MSQPIECFGRAFEVRSSSLSDPLPLVLRDSLTGIRDLAPFERSKRRRSDRRHGADCTAAEVPTSKRAAAGLYTLALGFSFVAATALDSSASKAHTPG